MKYNQNIFGVEIYMKPQNIENIYNKKKNKKNFSIHKLRALFRVIAIERKFHTPSIQYIMDRDDENTTDSKHYSARLTEQQRFNVYEVLSKYEKVCAGELTKQVIDYATI